MKPLKKSQMKYKMRKKQKLWIQNEKSKWKIWEWKEQKMFDRMSIGRVEPITKKWSETIETPIENVRRDAKYRPAKMRLF